MKTIIAKILKGEALTDAEKKTLGEFNPEAGKNNADKVKTLNAEVANLKAQLAQAGSTKDAATQQMEALQTTVEQLQQSIAAEKKAREEATAKAAAIERNQTIESIRTKNGINFIDGISTDFAARAFAESFKDVKDLTKADDVKKAVDAFKAANAGLIRAEGGGTGHRFGGGSDRFSGGGESNTDDMAKMLADAGVISKPTA